MAERSMPAVLHRPAGFLRTLALAGLIVIPLSSGDLSAQGGKAKKGQEVEKFAGKVTEIEKKGKAVRLVIEKEAGGNLDLLVTPKLKVVVTGKGDQSLFQTRTWVSSESLVLANNELFGRQFTVHYGNAPPPQCRPDPKASDVYLMSGQIVAVSEEALTLHCGRERENVKVAFEKGAAVEIAVSSNNPEFFTEGAAVGVEGTTHNGKFLPSQLTMVLEKPLTADDLLTLAGDKKATKAKPAANPRGNKKGPKTTIEPVEGEPIGSASDPFGVLGDKGDKKDAKGGDAKAGGKTAPEKKGSEKPPEK
jgi:hypothetical protein